MKISLTSDLHYGINGSITRGKFDAMMKMIVEDHPTALLVAGDWGSASMKSFELATKRTRKFFHGNIVGTLGNHDHWLSEIEACSILSIQDVMAMQNVYFNSYNIVDHVILMGDDGKLVLICSYPGWYKYNPPSNDEGWMPAVRGTPIHDYMRAWSDEKYTNMLRLMNRPDLDGCKKIVLTHHNIHPCGYHGHRKVLAMSGNFNHFHELKEAGMTTLCYGHTHVYEKDIIEGVQVVNSGSDYNKPQHITFEV